MYRFKIITLYVIAIATFANALWMILFPFNWYKKVPAEVPDFGPFNEHFVRDFGCCFLLTGIGLLFGLVRRQWLPAAILFATGFYTLHAATHIFDTLRNKVEPVHFLIDFPATYLPAILLVWFASQNNINRKSSS
jgi:hypothetical protein